MRKLKLQMQLSIDGFASTGPNDEQHWVTWAWEEIRPQVVGLLNSAGTILIGRKLAVDYIPYWEDVNTRPDDPMYEIGQWITAAKKVVFTKTLTTSPWNNTVVANGDLVEEVNRLKRESEKDLLVYGGTSFVSALIKANLVDEYHLYINPVALGRGEAVFNQLDHYKGLTLKNAIVYDCGIVKLHYEPK